MSLNLLLGAVQILTSVVRLFAFAFAVLTINRLSADTRLILLMGFLPYLAFFDILIQSISRARHLRGGPGHAHSRSAQFGYAAIALFAVGICYLAAQRSEAARVALLYGAWPLGAIGHLWEKFIAQRRRQLALALIELALLAGCTLAYAALHLAWPTLLLCLVSFPVARLIALTIAPQADVRAAAIQDEHSGRNDVSMTGWQMGLYVGASIGQQAVAASAAALPALYANLTGDARNLAVHVALFRSINSLAAVVSLTINAMSSRIFYRQTGSGLAAIEMRLLARRGVVIAVLISIAACAAAAALAASTMPLLFGLFILPAMAMINAESSLAYNRGYPQGTFHCQLLIFLLSLSFLLILIHNPLGTVAVLALFALYLLAVMPRILHMHRHILEHRFGLQ